MSEEVLTEDQSHYEISLTAGQAFIAFVLLLLSLAAAFAFGLLIGKGQSDDHLAMKKDAAVVITETPKKKITDLPADDFKPASSGGQPTPAVQSQVAPVTDTGLQPPTAVPSGPAYAQLLSSSDQKAAEALAEKLIGSGFATAYVERMVTDKGTTFRVRVKFPSEADAKAAEAKLKEFSKDVWITSK